MNEKAIRKLESLSDQIERYRKINAMSVQENKAHNNSIYLQGIGTGLKIADENYLIALKESVDRSIAELKEDADTYLIDDLDYEGVEESA